MLKEHNACKSNSSSGRAVRFAEFRFALCVHDLWGASAPSGSSGSEAVAPLYRAEPGPSLLTILTTHEGFFSIEKPTAESPVRLLRISRRKFGAH